MKQDTCANCGKSIHFEPAYDDPGYDALLFDGGGGFHPARWVHRGISYPEVMCYPLQFWRREKATPMKGEA